MGNSSSAMAALRCVQSLDRAFFMRASVCRPDIPRGDRISTAPECGEVCRILWTGPGWAAEDRLRQGRVPGNARPFPLPS